MKRKRESLGDETEKPPTSAPSVSKRPNEAMLVLKDYTVIAHESNNMQRESNEIARRRIELDEARFNLEREEKIARREVDRMEREIQMKEREQQTKEREQNMQVLASFAKYIESLSKTKE
ncbi:hypothetical protein AC1031_003493 [Aphanomyces cochlioides]|nr:hypothetical protein AC1031_003493 [Aphanomyces cochlioides]